VLRKLKQDTANYGWHNQNLGQSVERLHRGHSYRNLSTAWITVTRGQIKPNHRLARLTFAARPPAEVPRDSFRKKAERKWQLQWRFHR